MSFLKNNPLVFLLLALPLTLLAQLLGWPPVAVFALAALGIVPLASYIGEATEDLAYYTNPRLGALLNATLGNAAELIITITAVQAGLLELVFPGGTYRTLGKQDHQKKRRIVGSYYNRSRFFPAKSAPSSSLPCH